jgi:hypothetical protein
MLRKHEKATQLTKTTQDLKNRKIKKYIQVFHQFSHQAITQQSALQGRGPKRMGSVSVRDKRKKI